MFRLTYSPNWFFGKDIIIDVVAVIVLIMIGLVAIKYYKILGKTSKKHLYFGLSFLMMALAFLAKITTNFTIYYYRLGFIQQIKTNVIVHYVQYTPAVPELIFFTGFLAYHVLMLFGLYILLATLNDETKKSSIALAFFLIAVLTYFTNHLYYVFHITCLFITLLIIIKYQENYLKSRSQSTKYLIAGFSILALSQLLFMFVGLSSVIYVVAEIVMLAGFLLLLITLFSVLKHGKKKKQDRHHK